MIYMPVLKNQKWEAFAQALARGMSPHMAYAEAGYKHHKSNPAKLAKHSVIQPRVHELRSSVQHLVGTRDSASNMIPVAAASADKTPTVERLLGELEQARVRAMAEGQTSAAISAIMGKAKLREPQQPAHAQGDGFHVFDLSHVTDAQLATLEAIFGPLAGAGADDGGDRGGESA